MTKLRAIAANKEWLSLEDATNELSIALNEQVTLKDIWQLAIEKKLPLSVYFDEPKYGKESELIPIYNDKALLELAEEFDLYESDNIKNKLLSHLIAPERKKTLPYKGEEIDLSTYIKKIVHAVKARVLAFSLENEQQKNDIRKRLISLSGFETHLDLDAIMFDGLLLNSKNKVKPLLSGVWDILPTQHFLESLKAYFRSAKGFRVTGYEPFLYVKQNETIFKLMTSDTSLLFGKSPSQALLNSLNKDITWQAVSSFHNFATLVIRPENLQSFLNSRLLKPEANTQSATESDNQTTWGYTPPKRWTDMNKVVYDAIVTLNENGAEEPKNIKELLPTINSMLKQGVWKITKRTVVFNGCGDILSKESASVDSLNRILKSLIT